jgi:osmotically-inducible protein OsmY
MVRPNPESEISGATGVPAIGRTAEERLRRSSYPALMDVSCIAHDQVIYLEGSLPSHYLKQVAQEIALGVEGVHEVVNRIAVLTPANLRRLQKGQASTRRPESTHDEITVTGPDPARPHD